jgi:hypothetical protein
MPLLTIAERADMSLQSLDMMRLNIEQAQALFISYNKTLCLLIVIVEYARSKDLEVLVTAKKRIFWLLDGCK